MESIVYIYPTIYLLFVHYQNLHHHMTKGEIEHYFGVDEHDKGKENSHSNRLLVTHFETNAE